MPISEEGEWRNQERLLTVEGLEATANSTSSEM